MTDILVVDDVVEAAETLALLFEAVGHVSHAAFDGAQALALARRHAPHIIFLDLDMPMLDGYGAARAIRDSDDGYNPFIVALTGQSGDDVQRAILAAGFDFYMFKPANTNALFALVDDLSSRARARDAA